MSVVVRPAQIEELEAHGYLREEGYGFPAGYGTNAMSPFRDAALRDRVLGAYDEATGELAGTLAVVPFGQCFGGSVVSMGGVGGVVVAPHRRGEGIASALLLRAIETMHARGEVISALGPATMGVYRRSGWEVAGDQHWTAIPTAALAPLRGGSENFIVRPSVDTDREACQRVYGVAARKLHGMVIRPAFAWEARLRPQPGRYRYVVVDHVADAIVGYVIYRQQRAPRGGYQLFVDDLYATSWNAEAVLWRLLGGQQAQAREAIVAGVSLDGLTLRLAEQVTKRVHDHQWMLRLIDAPAAVAARKYAPTLVASVTLEITDPLVTTNCGLFVLTVTDGRGTLAATAGGEPPQSCVHLDVGTFAALYSGHVSAQSLVGVGKLEGAHDDDIANLDAIFRGPPSVMAIEDF